MHGLIILIAIVIVCCLIVGCLNVCCRVMVTRIVPGASVTIEEEYMMGTSEDPKSYEEGKKKLNICL